jgi:hypothetical protein
VLIEILLSYMLDGIPSYLLIGSLPQ